MSSNTLHTKKQLSLSFAIIVFTIVTLLGVIFFSAKYFQISRNENLWFNLALWNLSKDKSTLENILERQSRWAALFPKWKRRKKSPQNQAVKIAQRGFINVVVISKDGYIIKSQIRDNIEINVIEDLLENRTFSLAYQDNGFLLWKVEYQDEWQIIIFKKVWYPLEEYLTELLYFILLSVIFSGIIFFVWRRFVDRAFIPIEENMADMRDFIHNAWHELKTPLAVIDSNLQLIEQTKSYDPELNSEMKWEVLRLNSLIWSLINLSWISSINSTNNNDLLKILEEILKDHSHTISEKKITLKKSVRKWIKIEANRDYLYMLLTNIIQNAIKYNRDGWSIYIDYSKKSLSVRDSWIWINMIDQKKVFNRFFQVDNSRGSKWFWIGLSLVKKIADLYKWKISLESEEWKWTTVRVTFV